MPLLLIATMFGCGVIGTPRFASAFEACAEFINLPDSDHVPDIRLTDDDAALVMQALGEDDDLILKHFEARDCIFDELGTPESIRTEIDNTSAMMGQLDAESDGIEYEWTYHPDNGLDLFMTDRDAQ